MEEQNEKVKVTTQVATLESEVKGFAEGLSFWEKYLAHKILTGTHISDNEIDTAYSYLLEELTLKVVSVKPKIAISYNGGNSGSYKLDLLFHKLENVQGVNALAENQVIEFSPTLTIIYGANGSGKSGYVRLMKKVFYSKAPEEIIHNIHLKSGHKPIFANFTFHSSGSDIPLVFPTNSANAEFKQFAVFDNGSVKHHLDHKNEFEFRPAGLNFFSDFTEAIKRVELKLNNEIATKQTSNNFADLFDGESEIKTLIQSLSAKTKIDNLKKFTPFSEKDNLDKAIVEKKYDELLLASKSKEKEIQTLENIKKLIEENKKAIEVINSFFTTDYLTYVEVSIADCLTKESIANVEGIENFKTDRIDNVGTTEWKNFIVAAEKFAKQQKTTDVFYPKNKDNCLFCQQPLSDDAQKLISNYWIFIKSVAEQNAKKAQDKLTEIKVSFEKLNFDILPAGNVLSAWLTEKYPHVITSLKESLAVQESLKASVILDLKSKMATKRTETTISISDYDSIISTIEASTKLLRDNEQSVELNRLMKEKTYLFHKEKFNIHLAKFELYVSKQQWITKARSLSWMSEKRKITDYEKYLSGKYFNQKYIDTFNQECIELNGNFGIDISYTGSGGTSFRQLTLKGRNPAAILSEGEQKVIALADFITEMKLSEVNRGIVFDDPVNSLDEGRKKDIALRIVKESANKQVIIFTHDLVFVSNIITISEEGSVPFLCHWIENRSGNPGQVWLRNSPSYEKEYRNAEPVRKIYIEANKLDCPPAQREFLLKSGFTALRTCYEVLVINDLFQNVVQRYNERVSVDTLSKVYFNSEVVDELLDSFAKCCRYMEGHTHSDKYAYVKPEPINLNEEIQRYEATKTKIRKTKKPSP